MSKRVQRRFTDDFKREAVRLTETSGRTIKQVADDLGNLVMQLTIALLGCQISLK